jgi:hypothetical protein
VENYCQQHEGLRVFPENGCPVKLYHHEGNGYHSFGLLKLPAAPAFSGVSDA